MAEEREPRNRSRPIPVAPDPEATSRLPRYEHADPEEGGAEAIEVEVWGERTEVRRDETVDGDFNGAPELAGIDATRDREGADVVEVMEGAKAGGDREDRPAAVMLEERIAEQRSVLLERMPEARAAGLGDLFAATAAATDSGAGGAPLVADTDVLRQRLARIDAALERLEARRTGAGAP